MGGDGTPSRYGWENPQSKKNVTASAEVKGAILDEDTPTKMSVQDVLKEMMIPEEGSEDLHNIDATGISAAEMYKQYAKEARAHGRSLSVTTEDEPPRHVIPNATGILDSNRDRRSF